MRELLLMVLIFQSFLLNTQSSRVTLQESEITVEMVTRPTLPSFPLLISYTFFSFKHFLFYPHSYPSVVAALANNGWIWDGNPRVDFASKISKSYMKREVIVWEDCVKLRYGSSPEDNLWLWDHMAGYTSIVARLCHGLRIDNAHSTPIHVAQYFLDIARYVTYSSHNITTPCSCLVRRAWLLLFLFLLLLLFFSCYFFLLVLLLVLLKSKCHFFHPLGD
jgi:hypothetical protein